MEKCIQSVKETIERQVKMGECSFFGEPFSRYQKFYYCTNENISEYLNLANFNGKSDALSVMGSGDHIFNLITMGITNIDTFDTNELTEYYVLGLRRAMILKYDYEEFRYLTISLLRSNQVKTEEINEIINGLLPYMDIKYRIFWKSIIDFNYKIQREYGTNINLFSLISAKNLVVPEFNNYLNNKTNYNLLRERIKQANISFKCVNAVNLAEEYDGKYDFILLSNIIDYFFKSWGMAWKYPKLREYEKELEKITNDGGVIFLKYIMSYVKRSVSCERIFPNSSTTKKDLTDEEVHKISVPFDDVAYAGMVLKRVKQEDDMSLKV